MLGLNEYKVWANSVQGLFADFYTCQNLLNFAPELSDELTPICYETPIYH